MLAYMHASIHRMQAAPATLPWQPHAARRQAHVAATHSALRCMPFAACIAASRGHLLLSASSSTASLCITFAAATKFALSEAGYATEEAPLTHMGQSLADIDDFSKLPELDDLDEDVVEELVSQYHFGGGGGGGEGEGGEAMGRGPDGRPKTRKEVRGVDVRNSVVDSRPRHSSMHPACPGPAAAGQPNCPRFGSSTHTHTGPGRPRLARALHACHADHA